MSKDISITPQDAAVGIIEEEGEWIIIEHKKRTSTDEDGDNPQSSRTATTQAANPQVVEQGDCLAESPLSDTVDDPTAARNTADGTTFKERKKEKKPRLEGSRGYYRSRGRGRGGEVRKYRYSGYKPPFWDTKPRDRKSVV